MKGTLADESMVTCRAEVDPGGVVLVEDGACRLDAIDQACWCEGVEEGIGDQGWFWLESCA